MNILRRSNNQPNGSPKPDTSQIRNLSVVRRIGPEAVMAVIGKFIIERRLMNISMLEIEGGIVVQGVTDVDTDKGPMSFLQTHVISEADLRAMIERHFGNNNRRY